MSKESSSAVGRRRRFRSSEQFSLQMMILPALLLTFLFAYIPLYGIVIAFKDFNFQDGILHSPFVALKHFREFFQDFKLPQVIRNTLILNLVSLLVSFPAPIILALLLNELREGFFKKSAQTISYLPHFLSWVIYAGLILELLRPDSLFSSIGQTLGLLSGPTNFLARGQWFYSIFILSSLVKGIGYGSIIYMAALANVDQEIIEASIMDGANRWHRIRHIMIPAISGTIMILLILAVGSILNTGFEQILIFQNNLNIRFSETLDTYVYKIGISQQRYSYSTAVNLIKSLFSIGLVLAANFISRCMTKHSLF